MPKLPDLAREAALIALVSAALPVAAQAQLTEQAVMDCAVVVAADARLACFDDIARGLGPEAAQRIEARRAEEAKAARAAAEAARLAEQRRQAEAARAAELTAEQAFGLEDIKPGEGYPGRALDEVSATIVSTNRLPGNEWIIQLDNGQAWRTNDSIPVGVRVGKTVVIKRGFGGSYRLTVGSRTAQASRVR